VEGISDMRTRMVRVPLDLLERLRKQHPDLEDVSDTVLVSIILRRSLKREEKRTRR